jgi:hypothetical protein
MSELTEYDHIAGFYSANIRALMNSLSPDRVKLAVDTLCDAMENGRGMVRVAAAQTILKLALPVEDEETKALKDAARKLLAEVQSRISGGTRIGERHALIESEREPDGDDRITQGDGGDPSTTGEPDGAQTTAGLPIASGDIRRPGEPGAGV